MEPQLFKLTEKCTDTIKDLEEEEKRLAEQIQLETDKQKQRVHRQKAARSGLSNIKKLQSLTRRKDELSRSATELDEVLEQKRQEFSQLMERANQVGPIRRTRRYPSHVRPLSQTDYRESLKETKGTLDSGLTRSLHPVLCNPRNHGSWY